MEMIEQLASARCRALPRSRYAAPQLQASASGVIWNACDAGSRVFLIDDIAGAAMPYCRLFERIEMCIRAADPAYRTGDDHVRFGALMLDSVTGMLP